MDLTLNADFKIQKFSHLWESEGAADQLYNMKIEPINKKAAKNNKAAKITASSYC